MLLVKLFGEAETTLQTMLTLLQAAGLPEVIETGGVPVMLYAKRSEVEPSAVQQLIKLAESPLPVSGLPLSAAPAHSLSAGTNQWVLHRWATSRPCLMSIWAKVSR